MSKPEARRTGRVVVIVLGALVVVAVVVGLAMGRPPQRPTLLAAGAPTGPMAPTTVVGGCTTSSSAPTTVTATPLPRGHVAPTTTSTTSTTSVYRDPCVPPTGPVTPCTTPAAIANGSTCRSGSRVSTPGTAPATTTGP